MRQLLVVALVLGCLGVAGFAQAEDKCCPVGTWKWTMKRGDQTIEMTLKLKLEGDKLTGCMVGRSGQETPIADGKFKDGEVSFTVTREREGRKMVSKYAGKVSETTIKGKVSFEREGQAQERDWEATRAKE